MILVQTFFSTLNFVLPEEWKNSHEFGVRYGAGYQSNYGWDYSGASNLEELFTRVSPYFLRRLKRDVLKELPPKTFVDIPIELTEAEYKEYEKLENYFYWSSEEFNNSTAWGQNLNNVIIYDKTSRFNVRAVRTF